MGGVNFLSEKGVPVDTKNVYGKTPLAEAAYSGHLDVVKYLSEKGANLETQEDQGATHLVQAVKRGQLGVVKYLLSRQANPHVVSKDSKSIQEFAAEALSHLRQKVRS